MPRFTEWCPELQQEMEAPFPKEAEQSKSLKGNKITFIPWHLYVQRLNYLLGNGWSMEAPIPMQAGGKLVIAVGLTILGVTRWNVGDEDAEHEGFGSASVNAFAQSYKRAAALFGMGLTYYDKMGAADAVRQDQVEQPWDRELTFGKNRGKRLGDLDGATLQSLIDYCAKQEGQQFADLASDARATIKHKAEALTHV